MTDPYVLRVAGELADLALADQERTGDTNIVDRIGNMIGASSQVLEEAFLTAIRVRRAETRARELLAERASQPVVPLAELIEDQSDDPTAEPTETPAATETSEPDPDDAPKQPGVNLPRRVKR